MPTIANAVPVSLNDEDRHIIDQVDDSLAAGIQVRDWWRRTDAGRSYREHYDLQRAFNPARRSLAFFDRAELPIGEFPVMGVVQEMTFDFSKPEPDLPHQIREFVLRYLLRVSDYRRPAAFMLRDLHRTTAEQAQLDGWGYSQVYYKLRDGGRVGKFAEEDQAKFVDLRELGSVYEWIVAKARLFNLTLNVSPLGDTYPHLVVPVASITEEYLITSADFIVNEEDPAPGVLGRYGVGGATLRDTALREGPLLWGPGRFYPGFSAFEFEVRSTGETVVTSPFAVNRPDRLIGINPDPLSAGVRLADLFSFGMASRLFPGVSGGFDPVLSPIAVLNGVTGNFAADQFGVSKESLERYLLVEHYMAVYDLLAGASLTYCRVPDWTAPEEDLPSWVRNGLVE